jgi:hypothetical protein
MTPIVSSCIVLAFVLAGAILGVLLRGVLPYDHLNEASKDVIELTIGLVRTMLALVLGLLVSSKDFYDTQVRRADPEAPPNPDARSMARVLRAGNETRLRSAPRRHRSRSRSNPVA